MTLTAGVITLVSKTQNSASLSATAASGGTSPYTQQWYRSTTTGFTPGGGNIISGATGLTLADTGLVPNVTYYYKVVYTDVGHSNETIEATQLAVTTLVATLQQNQFQQVPYVGQIDLRFPYNTVSVQIDLAETDTGVSGSPVKMVDSADGTPKVLLCDADTDECLGFINYDIKSKQFVAGDRAEISMAGNVIFLYATAAVARGVQVCLDIAGGGVKAVSGSGGENIVGWAYDKATQAGQLIRVFLKTPSFLFDA